MTSPRILQDLELLTMLADLEDASTPDYANRPLEEWEQDTDWVAIAAALIGAYTAIEQELTTFHRVYVDELDTLLGGATTVAEKVTRFFTWSMQLPANVRAAADRAVRGIAGTLARLQDKSAGITVDDAVAAKITPDRRRVLPAAASMERWLSAAALPVAMIPARVGQLITRDVATPYRGSIPGGSAPDPQQIVNLARNMSLAGAVDKGRQAAHQASGAGRLEAVQNVAADDNVGYYYASELLDENTCTHCADIDGTRYDTLEAAVADYPGFGGYKNCDGGDRCRGTIVIVAATEAPPTLDRPGDDPPDYSNVPGGAGAPFLRANRPTGTPEDWAHIFERHQSGRNSPRATEFPPSWGQDRIRTAVAEVLAHPMAIDARPGRPVVYFQGVVDGRLIEVQVLANAPGRIHTAYPVNGPGVVAISKTGERTERPLDMRRLRVR